MQLQSEHQDLFQKIVTEYYKHQKDAYLEEYLEFQSMEAKDERQKRYHQEEKYKYKGMMEALVQLGAHYRITREMILIEVLKIKKLERIVDGAVEEELEERGLLAPRTDVRN